MELLRRNRRSLWIMSLLVLTLDVAAQAPRQDDAARADSPGQNAVSDPLGRGTPRGTMAGFVYAVDREDFVAAARYMQLTESELPHARSLARDLNALMDRYLSQALTTISDSSAGALDDGLAMDRERAGTLTMGDRRTDVILVRVTDPQSGPIWLISSETLAQVPALRDVIDQSWIERAMPATLVNRELAGMSLAHWVVFAATLLVPFITLALILSAAAAIAGFLLRDPVRRADLQAWHARIRWPLVTTLTLITQLMAMPSMGFPLTFRIAYARIGLILTVIAATWLIQRVIALGFERARALAWGRDRASTQSLMLLGERLLKATVILIAIFAILSLAGVNTKTALAGVGIGGIALALGAQRTVENLLGGIFLLSDRAIAVGDLCSISNRLGWVEDITLRSVRLRTLDQTIVSIPAGVLAQAGIENFATRHKILAQSVLRLRYGTSVTQLRRILEGIRQLLDENPRIERGTSRIRLVAFGPEAIELELFAYLMTADVPEFLAWREELLLEIAAAVESAGSDFAPTRFIYMEEGPDQEQPPATLVARDAVPSRDVQHASSATAAN
ncbi:MAG TPA: mechanosensitive ion channel family protein [Steroidobacteraceae bacterium]